MGRWIVLARVDSRGRSAREGGYTLIELTITLCLLMAIALFGLKTMIAGSIMQNWAIAQSMTDAYAGIETSIAQREVFANISTDATRAVYPNTISTTVTIGQTPFKTVTATLVRTYHAYTLDADTGALSYLLESYVVYTDGKRNYCKLSKVYRTQ
jgi:type II secretory pathway pseudopilin PulG